LREQATQAQGASLQGEDLDCGGVAAVHYGGVRSWERLDQRVTDNAVKKWRNKRLHACVAANGGDFEHLLW